MDNVIDSRRFWQNLIFLVFWGCLSLTNVKACPASEIKPLAQKPSEIDYVQGLQYALSPSYTNDLDNTVQLAEKFCDDYRQQNPDSKNLAIVSDLDETLLDNRPFYKVNPKFNHKAYHEWVISNVAPLLEPTAKFLSRERKNGYAIFLLTGRRERDRVATTYNLVKQNVDYDGLFLKPNDFKGHAYDFKTNVRKAIEDMGFKIVENIGDQVSDLYGGYAIDCVKLPNKMYFVP